VNLLAQPKQQYFAKVLKPAATRLRSICSAGRPARQTPITCSTTSWAAATIRKSRRGEANLGGYCNKKLDELADKMLVEADTAKRDQLIKEAFEIAPRTSAISRCTSRRWHGACRRR
jgi:peptide/nickel transport system substrate-binding protein